VTWKLTVHATDAAGLVNASWSVPEGLVLPAGTTIGTGRLDVGPGMNAAIVQEYLADYYPMGTEITPLTPFDTVTGRAELLFNVPQVINDGETKVFQIVYEIYGDVPNFSDNGLTGMEYRTQIKPEEIDAVDQGSSSNVSATGVEQEGRHMKISIIRF